MTPRQVWFKKRVVECLEHLSELNKIEDWHEFMIGARILSEELSYAVNEWDKYYHEQIKS